MEAQELSVTEAGKAEDSVTVGSGKSAMKPLKDNIGPARGLWKDKKIVTHQPVAGSKENARMKPKLEAEDAEAGKAKPPVTDAGKPEESVTEAVKAEDSVTLGSGKSAVKRLKDTMGSARGLKRDKNILTRQQEVGSKEKARTKPRVEAKDAEAGKAKPTVTDAGKAEDYETVGSGKLSMNQEVIGLKCTDNEEIFQQMLKYRLGRGGDSFISDEAEEKEMRAMLKAVQETTARMKSLFHWPQELPAKDEESGKSEAPITVAGKPEESAMDQEVISDNKESLEQVLKDRTTEPAADPSSMTIQDDHVDRSKSALAKKTADEEAKAYALFRNYWESNYCNDCDNFQQITVLSPMQYTHCTPEMITHNVAETLQIFSMKLKLIDGNAGCFQLPLSVYGMVAVRDTLDYKRNLLFSRGRTVAQELTQDDPFLLLTGPSRAIVSMDKVHFEIYLNVKGASVSQDKSLMTCVRGYAGGCGTALCFENAFCTLEVCLGTVKHAVQATILGVQIVNKKELCPSNFRYGGLVAYTPWTTADSGVNQKIVLIESEGRKMPQGEFGYVHLWRQVVSVEDGGGLDVVIQAYTKSGAVAAEGHVHFTAQNSQVSQQQCIIGEAQINVTVAWSVVPTNMDDVVYNV